MARIDTYPTKNPEDGDTAIGVGVSGSTRQMSLGSAAGANTGTDPEQVPTNTDFREGSRNIDGIVDTYARIFTRPDGTADDDDLYLLLGKTSGGDRVGGTYIISRVSLGDWAFGGITAATCIANVIGAFGTSETVNPGGVLIDAMVNRRFGGSITDQYIVPAYVDYNGDEYVALEFRGTLGGSPTRADYLLLSVMSLVRAESPETFDDLQLVHESDVSNIRYDEFNPNSRHQGRPGDSIEGESLWIDGNIGDSTEVFIDQDGFVKEV